MSRHRRNKQVAIQRAAVPIAQPTSGHMVSIPSSVWQMMLAHAAPQKDVAQTFSPSAPLNPIPGITPAAGPRQWSYMPGFNLAGNDRTLLREYIPAFDQLRMLAQTYSAIGIAERIWCDLIPKMTVQVTLTDELKAQGKDDKDFAKEITAYRKFFEKPDGYNDIHSWLRMAIVEQTQIDALCIFKRKNRGGKLEGLDIVDGKDIKPLLDERGRVPIPPYAAFQQYSYGTPGAGYTTDEFIYYKEAPRTFTPYGFSRVERIILLVNQALRKQKKDLARFTEGNVPAGLMEVPEALNWTPDQIDAYEQSWNSLLAGNPQQQVRIRFTQPGMKYTPFDQYESREHLTEFDDFLTTIAFGTYGVSKADAAMTADIHKSADQGQQNSLYRRTVDPTATAYGGILTGVLHVDIGDTRFVVKFGGFEEEEDTAAKVSTFFQGIQGAMIAPSDAAAMMKWPDVPKTGPGFFNAKTGQFVPLANFEIGSDMRTAQDTATKAGLELAANPQAQQQDGEEDDSESQPQQAGKTTGGQKSKDGKPGSNGSMEKPSGKDKAEPRYTISELLALIEEKHQTAREETEVGRLSLQATDLASEGHADQRDSTSLISTERAIALSLNNSRPAMMLELNAWQMRAMEDVRRGQPFREFVPRSLPAWMRAYIDDGLSSCVTTEDIKSLFKRAKAEQSPMISKMGSCQCETCHSYDGKAVNDTQPPYHDGCTCTVESAEKTMVNA